METNKININDIVKPAEALVETNIQNLDLETNAPVKVDVNVNVNNQGKEEFAAQIDGNKFFRAGIVRRGLGKILDYIVPVLIVTPYIARLFPIYNEYNQMYNDVADQFEVGTAMPEILEVFPTYEVLRNQFFATTSLIALIAFFAIIVIIASIKKGKTLGKMATKEIVRDSSTGKPASTIKMVLREVMSFGLLVIIPAFFWGLSHLGYESAVLLWLSSWILFLPLVAMFSTMIGREKGQMIGRTYYDKILNLEVVLDI